MVPVSAGEPTVLTEVIFVTPSRNMPLGYFELCHDHFFTIPFLFTGRHCRRTSAFVNWH